MCVSNCHTANSGARRSERPYRAQIQGRMKLLVYPSLQAVSSTLEGFHTGDSVIQGRLEAYSCKRASSDKKLSQQLDRMYSDQSGSLERAHSTGSSGSLERQYSGFTPILSSTGAGSVPDEFVLGESPGFAEDGGDGGSLGVIPDHSMRKLFINLLLTLNSTYPDYDFSSVKPEEFVEEANIDLVVHSINSALAKAMSQDPSLGHSLWGAVEEAIKPRECRVYSYIPDVESSPFCDGTLWSFNYFLFNKNLKRVLFFTCNCVRPEMHEDSEPSDNEMSYRRGGDMDEDFEMDRQMDFSMDDM